VVRRKKEDEEFLKGWELIRRHPLFGALGGGVVRRDDGICPSDGWAVVDSDGVLHAHPTRHGTEREWAWVFAHCLLHLGLGHLDTETDDPGSAARDVVVNRFLAGIKFGTAPVPLPLDPPTAEEDVLARQWRRGGVPESVRGGGTAGVRVDTLVKPPGRREPDYWTNRFAYGLTAAVTAAVDVAGGARSSIDANRTARKPWDLALSWFVASYPLLGALASSMRIVADAELAQAWDISVAAVNAQAGEIYINPLTRLHFTEWRFVLAHEMLHAALRHGDRVGGRDPYLWNVAADYVINGWLVEMAVGTMPGGLLHDPELRGLSAESVYDRIAGDLRRYRKLATLRGRGLGDVLGEPLPHAGSPRRATDLDDFYRRSLLTGLAYHDPELRGTLPAGLVQEIRALEHPPLEWDAQLARWFEEFVPVLERRRSYARASRRQSSTPHIPRPGWVRPSEAVRQSTFGVVLDTSGSMDVRLLGKALGAIASYSAARDVPAARVVFCDAVAYDAGYVPVEDIAGRVAVRGRGGTRLQPGVDLLERADDFPPDGPVLVITDGYCDVLRIRREHAFLIPTGRSLPFRPCGPVFRLC
jgi:predicted metal-dependent peptidase